MPNLCANSNHEHSDIRNAALETLGFICEELSSEDLTTELKGLIIEALVTNISELDEAQSTTLLAIKGLFNALPYTSHNFENQAARDFIMNKIFLALKST